MTPAAPVPGPSFEIALPTPDATRALAEAIAARLRPGDVVALVGGLGAGKSAFARAAIARLLAAEGRREDIPSPTWTLAQIYETRAAEIWHADLYRLGDAGEIVELGLEEAFATAVCFVEWADRLGPLTPARRLEVGLAFAPGAEDGRIATLRPVGSGWDWLGAALVDAAEPVR
jgi:tRNA threonylcarbamoyladenosine biosynthesis protein TsaE